eukprot:CAMPEP_0206170038 /NCGR_PEP_ID=MMETSP1474-20131121/37629_1 /ASSEMBLY_ACC=CAM_ASM_001110 /TAXON_ID=97495 /ORGANISM="Imantonia sp., Strain RCC918" /LENGTH=76 /DNA_ID=CAMNT_0053576473 /DNA_START=801 /DNA_END=1028 /DNA_ORIENTATION=+
MPVIVRNAHFAGKENKETHIPKPVEMFDAEPSPGQVSLPYGHPSYYGAIAPNADNQPTPSFHKVETSNTTQFSSDE